MDYKAHIHFLQPASTSCHRVRFHSSSNFFQLASQAQVHTPVLGLKTTTEDEKRSTHKVPIERVRNCCYGADQTPARALPKFATRRKPQRGSITLDSTKMRSAPAQSYGFRSLRTLRLLHMKRRQQSDRITCLIEVYRRAALCLLSRPNPSTFSQHRIRHVHTPSTLSGTTLVVETRLSVL